MSLMTSAVTGMGYNRIRLVSTSSMSVILTMLFCVAICIKSFNLVAVYRTGICWQIPTVSYYSRDNKPTGVLA